MVPEFVKTLRQDWILRFCVQPDVYKQERGCRFA